MILWYNVLRGVKITDMKNNFLKSFLISTYPYVIGIGVIVAGWALFLSTEKVEDIQVAGKYTGITAMDRNTLNWLAAKKIKTADGRVLENITSVIPPKFFKKTKDIDNMLEVGGTYKVKTIGIDFLWWHRNIIDVKSPTQ